MAGGGRYGGWAGRPWRTFSDESSGKEKGQVGWAGLGLFPTALLFFALTELALHGCFHGKAALDGCLGGQTGFNRRFRCQVVFRSRLDGQAVLGSRLDRQIVLRR